MKSIKIVYGTPESFVENLITRTYHTLLKELGFKRALQFYTHVKAYNSNNPSYVGFKGICGRALLECDTHLYIVRRNGEPL